MLRLILAILLVLGPLPHRLLLGGCGDCCCQKVDAGTEARSCCRAETARPCCTPTALAPPGNPHCPDCQCGPDCTCLRPQPDVDPPTPLPAAPTLDADVGAVRTHVSQVTPFVDSATDDDVRLSSGVRDRGPPRAGRYRLILDSILRL